MSFENTVEKEKNAGNQYAQMNKFTISVTPKKLSNKDFNSDKVKPFFIDTKKQNFGVDQIQSIRRQFNKSNVA